eukprot:6596196-Pyramimonas_sp.AAC.1
MFNPRISAKSGCQIASTIAQVASALGACTMCAVTCFDLSSSRDVRACEERRCEDCRGWQSQHLFLC